MFVLLKQGIVRLSVGCITWRCFSGLSHASMLSMGQVESRTETAPGETQHLLHIRAINDY